MNAKIIPFPIVDTPARLNGEPCQILILPVMRVEREKRIEDLIFFDKITRLTENHVMCRCMIVPIGDLC